MEVFERIAASLGITRERLDELGLLRHSWVRTIHPSADELCAFEAALVGRALEDWLAAEAEHAAAHDEALAIGGEWLRRSELGALRFSLDEALMVLRLAGAYLALAALPDTEAVEALAERLGAFLSRVSVPGHARWSLLLRAGDRWRHAL